MLNVLPLESYVLAGLLLVPWVVDRLLGKVGGHPAKARRCPRCGHRLR
jgi:hypothetical protein